MYAKQKPQRSKGKGVARHFMEAHPNLTRKQAERMARIVHKRMRDAAPNN